MTRPLVPSYGKDFMRKISADKHSIYVVMVDQSTKIPTLTRVTRREAKILAETKTASFASCYKGTEDLTPDIIDEDIRLCGGLSRSAPRGTESMYPCGHERSAENSIQRNGRTSAICAKCKYERNRKYSRDRYVSAKARKASNDPPMPSEIG